MKTVSASQTVQIPEGVKVHIANRVATVTGPRGTLTKCFRHAHMDFQVLPKYVKVDLFFANRKQLACVRTVCSHLQNLIKGVTKGYEYKMRFAYAHFPISVTLADKGNVVEIRNFLGEKIVRRVKLLDGVTAVLSTKIKDELVLTGNSLENVSLSAALCHQSVLVKNKDIRKFLDGIYVSEKGVLGR